MLRRFIFFGLATVLGMFLYAQDLTDKQRSLAGRYAQLEQILLRLSETSANSNPRQATLLNKALLESKDKLLVQRLQTLVNVLERRQLSEAITGQSAVEQDLLLLLKLLESMNRDEKREQEKEQIKEFLKEIEEIIQSERILKNQTYQQDTQNLPTLENEQRDIRMRAQALQERMTEQETGGRRQEAEEENQNQQQQDDQQPQEGQQREEQQSQQQNQQQQEQMPTHQALQRAMERMKQAEEQLRQAEKEGAFEAQEEAIAELQRLKEELEKILRQLREEELLQTLEKLEARFKRMLQQEQTIRTLTGTLIDEIKGEQPPEQRQVKIRADRLGIDQQSVIDDADTALLLLREDGTAQAMVESLLQARFDMMDAKKRLNETTLDAITLHIEDAIIDALQEMLEAIQAAIEEARERQENKENQNEQQQGEAMAEEPLIQLLAELRMIRSMQRRVNERTTRYDTEIKQMLEQPEPDLRPFKSAVEELARQQNRISRILHELKIGRTQ
jgi:hypothetical protein